MSRPLADGFARLAFQTAMATSGRSALAALLRDARAPRRTQDRALARILDQHRATGFGRDHGYDRIGSFDAFRAAVPIRDYEGLRPWIDRQIETGDHAFSAETPLMYARTSGTIGRPKLVPVTPDALSRLKRAQRAGAWAQHRLAPLFEGRILVMAGAMAEDSLADGTPVGATTGLIYATMPAAVRRRYVVPPQVFAIDDPELKYRVVTRLALQHPDLSAVSTANPSTLLRLRDTSRANWSAFLAEIADGACADAAHLPEDQRRAVLSAIRGDPGRAAELARRAEGGEPTIEQLWPRLAGVVTWTGGSCALAANTVAQTLPPGARLMEAGYVCSEFRGTVMVDPTQDFGLPLLDDVVFEFVPVAAWDAGGRDTLRIDELEEGGEYQVIVTTSAGLARYHLNDVLQAGPRIGETPSLSFLRKGRGVTSITGEKLTEDQTNAAVALALAAAGLHAPFHLVLADEAAATYRILLELEPGGPAPDPAALAETIDRTLAGLNLEYEAKRATGRLRPPEVWLLAPGAGGAYRAHCLAAGQRDAQFKVLALQTARDCDFDFSGWRRGDGG